jgi:hypothetical protein
MLLHFLPIKVLLYTCVNNLCLSSQCDAPLLLIKQRIIRKMFVDTYTCMLYLYACLMFAVNGRSVLSKDQLAQRRGRDQGDDVLVSGNDAGDLGIVSSNAGMPILLFFTCK